MRDPRRWLLWVGLAAGVGFIAASFRGGGTRAGAHQECLTHSDCAKALRCYVVPKDDGFATFGVCVEPCLDDLQCYAGLRCTVTAKGNQQLVPVRAGLEPGERVCLPAR